MFFRFRHFPMLVLATGALLAVQSSANAGWMGFRNDTTATLVIQETIFVGKTSHEAKPQKIFANETVRDTPPSGSVQRKFSISEAARPDKVLYTAQFACPAADENILFVIKTDSRGVLIIESVKVTAGVAKPKK